MKYKNDYFEIDTDDYALYSKFTDDAWWQITNNSDMIYPELSEYNRYVQEFIYDNVFYNSDFTEKVLNHIQEEKYPCIDSMIIEKIKQIQNIDDVVLSFLENNVFIHNCHESDEYYSMCNFFADLGIMKHIYSESCGIIYNNYYIFRDIVIRESSNDEGDRTIINFTKCWQTINNHLLEK